MIPHNVQPGREIQGLTGGKGGKHHPTNVSKHWRPTLS